MSESHTDLEYPMNVDLATAAFYYMAGASVASAALAVTRRNPVHSMLWVLALFMHVAGIFLALHAEFLAAVQVIVYAGAILIFYLFIVMLLDLTGEETRPRFGNHWKLAVVAGGVFFIIMVLALKEQDKQQQAEAPIEAADEQAAFPELEKYIADGLVVEKKEDGFWVYVDGALVNKEPLKEKNVVGYVDNYLGNLARVGRLLFGRFALPFEIVSLVLLAAIVGAVVLARRRSTES